MFRLHDNEKKIVGSRTDFSKLLALGKKSSRDSVSPPEPPRFFPNPAIRLRSRYRQMLEAEGIVFKLVAVNHVLPGNSSGRARITRPIM